ncbi:MAG: HlyD family efflux transporter periplasmic adaptor subunit [Ignavibacteria bacterium]|jgi:HlyD family secretion protein|nr:HlyD family efflux transporter periplasmic adaptor subunit [Ignavibacteria bacterium]MCU7503329.1 HlyD family efflux transporter periplasmic adaptor subunit [Ignavibacteria bacterium]MCU7515725.1 HlyD family efflux transporter periplasmic adaptor subunit [Ignavibacteria bacterium]
MKAIFFTGMMSLGLLLYGCGGGEDKNMIDASGTIEATNVTISSKVAGQVQKLYKDEGNAVKAGDTLLTVDHDLLSIQLEQALAGKDFAEAQLKLLRQGARSEDISQAEANTRQAQINLDQALKDKDRMARLYESKSITKKQYEDALARFELTQAQYNAASDNLKKMRHFARPEEIRQAEANLQKSVASVDLLKKNIQDSYVTSPMNGTLVKKFVEAGETVGPNSSLFRISDLSVVDLVIYVSEEELGHVKLGQKAEVTVDAFKNKTFEGKVIYISPEAEFTPKNIQTKDERTKLVFAVKIEISNPNSDLKAGMPADAVIKY